MSPAVLDMILETAIRMKMNLVIPSSFDLEYAVSDQLRDLLGEDFARIEPLLWGIMPQSAIEVWTRSAATVSVTNFTVAITASCPFWNAR